MTRSHNPSQRQIAVLLLVALAAAACGDDDRAEPASTSAARVATSVSAAPAPTTVVPTTVAPTTVVPTTVVPTTIAASPNLKALAPTIRAALAESLTPGFYTPFSDVVDSFPSGASIAIRIDGQPDLLIGTGTEASPAGAPFDPTAPFMTGEVTLNIVYALYDLLVDAGTIDPSVTLATWLPTYPSADQITAKMLRDGDYGGHGMAAITNWVDLVTSDNTRVWTLEGVLAEAANYPAGPIGSSGDNGTAATALALIIEQVTGRTLADLIEEHFTAPLRLADTGIVGGAQLPLDLSHGRFPLDGAAYTTADFPLTSYVSFNEAHAGLVSTLSDQLTLLHAIATGGVPGLDRLPTPDRFPTDRLISDDDGDRYIGKDFALNLHCPCTAVGDGHTGASFGRRVNAPGTTTHWYYFPEDDVTMIVHYNSAEVGSTLEVMQLAYRIHDLLATGT